MPTAQSIPMIVSLYMMTCSGFQRSVDASLLWLNQPAGEAILRTEPPAGHEKTDRHEQHGGHVTLCSTPDRQLAAAKGRSQGRTIPQ